MLGFGLPELIIVLVILLLLFGSTKLPKLARSLGESAGELQKGIDSVSKAKESTQSSKSSTKKKS